MRPDSRRRLSPHEFFRKPDAGSRLLRSFDQFHLAVASTVQDHHFAFGVAEDKHIPVAEMRLFDGFFKG